MIWDSTPWKKDIWKCARYFERLHLQQRALSASQCVAVEKRVFFSFYTIRKLIEAKKLSDECSSQEIRTVMYMRTHTHITHYNWHHLDRHFAFGTPGWRNWSLLGLCHQFVHSYIFQVMSDESSGLSGVMVASDHQKKKSLLEIKIDAIIKLFDSIASDDIVSLQYVRDQTTGEEKFTLLNRLPARLDIFQDIEKEK